MLPKLILLADVPDPPEGAVTRTHWLAFLGRLQHRPNGITLPVAREVFGGGEGELGRKEMAELLRSYRTAKVVDGNTGYRVGKGQALAPLLVLRAYERAHARLVDAYALHAGPLSPSALELPSADAVQAGRAASLRAGRALAPALEELPEAIEWEGHQPVRRRWTEPHHLLLTWLSDVYALGGSGEALFYAIAKQLLLRDQ